MSHWTDEVAFAFLGPVSGAGRARRKIMQQTAVLLGLLLLCGPLASADEAVFDADQLARIPARMQEFVEQKRIAGAVTLVATADRVVRVDAVGHADLSAGRAMQSDSIFRIASMTKPITATALMLLVSEGKLDVRDPVSKHIPAFSGQKLKDGSPARDVTILDVLTHTAGLVQPPRGGNDRSLQEIVDGIGRAPLEFAPG
jgi:CubicO group peptidase (beta-lactamase class C family)